MRSPIKRILPLILSLSLLPLPVLGAEETGFTDVHPGDWFAPYVEVCVGAGLMKGTGEGRFSPEATLNTVECVTLAYRLYDIRQGGDGSVETAPEDWGRLVLTAQDGTVIQTYTGDAGRGWDHVCIPLDEARQSWGREIAPGMTATLSDGETTCTGTLSWVEDYWEPLTFTAQNGDNMQQFGGNGVPGPDRWWRDLCWTVERKGLTELFDPFYFYETDADRDFFAGQITAAAGELEGINEVPSLPDCADEQVLSLYRAGILTGFDPSGTFNGQAALTRAEAAAMVARVLEPSLRLSFSPQPLPEKGYSLTYLIDGRPNCGVTYPICIFSADSEQETSGLLTLDGRLLPWPERGVPSHGLEEMGPYVKIAPYTGEDPYSTSPGMMDASGAWVVEPGPYDLVWPVEGGFYAWTTENWAQWQGYRLDLSGQVAEELGTIDREPEPPGGWDNYTVPDLHSWDGLTAHRHGVAEGAYYVNGDGAAASGLFDWCGAIGPDGRGFVGRDGKVYRIQFEE